jgi:hypothetical protein
MERKNYLMMLGAPKCGTTSLSTWLGEQPYAALTREKETLYFTDFDAHSWQAPWTDFTALRPTDIEAFDAQFHHKPAAELRIEASTDNLSCAAAPENIARFAERKDVGEVWLLAVLRDPIARIVSEYEHTLRMGWQSGSLLNSLKAEHERIEKGYHPLFRHVRRSSYASQIARYRELFGERLLILDFHQIRETAERRGLLEWMGYADEGGKAEMQHRNARSVVARPRTVGLLKNNTLQSMGRAIFPKALRPVVRDLITGGEVDRYTPTAAENDFMRDALQDEILACVEAPDIPTQNWASL